ncbi:MAG: fluoride efflux transporter CrcB [Verrucomicrobiota bacterium]
MFTYFLVALGSGLGGLARFAISGCVARQWGETLPWGTLLVNVSGSFLIGFFATLTEPGGRVFVSGHGRQFFMTGLMGGYTTFSSFSLQTLTLARDGQWLHAGANSVASLVLCLVAVWLGHVSAAALTARH